MVGQVYVKISFKIGEMKKDGSCDVKLINSSTNFLQSQNQVFFLFVNAFWL